MKFGVVIRSIGERTENLCREIVEKEVTSSNIHIVRNVYPQANAYLEMFKLAKKCKYDYFLGLDADVLLLPGWRSEVEAHLHKFEKSNTFRAHWPMLDYLTGKKLYRGFNLYKGKHLERCVKYLRLNMRIGKYNFLYKFKYANSGFYTKPETSIRTHFRSNDQILDFMQTKAIGIHGAFQFYKEYFRQMATRRHRDLQFFENDVIGNLSSNLFYKEFCPDILHDIKASELGWFNHMKFRPNNFKEKDTVLIEKILCSAGITEKTNEINFESYLHLIKNLDLKL